MKSIAYYRVSTQKQGQSGLGLEAQKDSVSQSYEPVREYTEIESGKNNHRPELLKAIETCKRLGAILVVAKLDRLARNVAFISTLMESGVEFVACDNPQANRLTVHILAAVAEDEARRISERTKAALTAAKKRGVPLGSSRPNHWSGRESLRLAGAEKARLKSAEVRRRRRDELFAYFTPKVKRMKQQGYSHQQVADALNEAGYRTARGSKFTKGTISRLWRNQ